jgi:PST family polysaccharide transporter
MLARAMTAAYILTEVVFAASFFGLAVVFIAEYGLVGAAYAHAVNYVAYLITLWYLTRPLLRNNFRAH